MSPTLHPHVEQWFAARGWRPFAFQHEVWAAYRAGHSGLIHSATGTGKTLAAFLGPVMEWLEQNPPPPPFHKGGSESSARVENPPFQKGQVNESPQPDGYPPLQKGGRGDSLSGCVPTTATSNPMRAGCAVT